MSKKKLVIPSDTTTTSGIAVHEPFRFKYESSGDRVNAIGMMVGSGVDFSRRCLMIIAKDGTITGCSPTFIPSKFGFIDYLLDTDSITIFGGAESEDQLPPEGEIMHPWSLREPPTCIAGIQPGVPFMTKYDTLDWPCMLALESSGNVRLLIFDTSRSYGRAGKYAHGNDALGGSSKPGNTENFRHFKFLNWLDPEEWVPRFEKHENNPKKDRY